MPGKQVSPLFFAAIASAVFVLSLSSCRDSKPLDSPTRGNIRISIDETFYPVFDSELAVFHSLYKYAHIDPLYAPEEQAMKEFLADSTKVIVLSRELNEEELRSFEARKLTPRLVKVATDAIALVIHPENKDTALTMEQLEQLFTGKTPRWNDLDPQNDSSALRVVFDNTSSSTARYIKEKFNAQLPAYCFAVNTNPEVVSYVAEHKNAIGVIGVNWISDSDDSTSLDFLKKVYPLRIIADSTDTRGKQPYQAYIAQGTYPLTRDIYMISREGRAGLGTGFMSFVASDSGQRIILKAGLVPSTMPIRIVGINN